MSGPKGGGYAVVSAEELERRALRAAQDRWQRLSHEYNGVVTALGHYEHGVMPASGIAEGNSGQVAALADSLESQIGVLRSRLSDHRVAAAIAAIPKININLQSPAGSATSPLASTADRPRTSATGVDSVSKNGQPDLGVKAEKVVTELVELTGQEPPQNVLRKVAGVRSASSRAQQRLALDDLRYSVQLIRDRHRAEQRSIRQRNEILAALDGCEGLEARRMYTAVSRIEPGQPVPITPAAAKELARRDSEHTDAVFVEAAVVDVLQELGYEVGDPMTVTVAERGALLELPGHPDHVARLRTQDGQLRFSVVRVGGETGDTLEDTSAEVTACKVFADVHEGLAKAGVQWTLQRKDAPGATRMAQANKRPTGVAAQSKKPGRRRRRATVEKEIGQ